MKLCNLKTNRIRNPLGFRFGRLSLSFEAEGRPEEDLDSLTILISTKEDFSTLLGSYAITLDDRTGYEPDLTLEGVTRYFWKVCGVSGGKPVESETAWFETGLLRPFQAAFIAPTFSDRHPILFRDFKAAGEIAQARLYICGLGMYEAYLNNEKIGDEYLTPDCNEYRDFLQYQTYDVTDMLAADNRLSVLLGNGWYKGLFGLAQQRNIGGDTFQLICELHIRYADGSTECICSDESWQCRRSPIQHSGIYDGEIMDLNDWNQEVLPVYLTGADISLLEERRSLPIRWKNTCKPTLIVTPKGEQVLDFGQNMVGFVQFVCREEAGRKIWLQVGEVLQEDCFYRDNLRSAKAEFIYVSDGQERVVRQHFTFYGFRFVKVEGMDRVDPADFTGMVLYSDLEQTGSIETSNPKLNRLFLNCLWGQRGNFLDVPTDCPQRDERMGWTADAQVFSRTACLNMDCLAFYEKYLHDMAVDQKKLNGGIPDYCPSFGQSEASGSVWADAATIMPMVLYDYYGDKTVLAEHYPMIRDYIDFLFRLDESTGGLRLYHTGFHFGDWLAQDGVCQHSVKGGTDDYYLASCYYYNSVDLARQAALLLGKTEDAERYESLMAEIKAAILREYYSPNGRPTIDTQTAYIVALYFGIYVDKQRVLDGLKNRLHKDFYKITCGFVGAPLICNVLCDNGMEEDAYRLLMAEDLPSWLYTVNMGGTTIWERWNSLLPNGKISGIAMNSFNHYSYGSIMEFVYTRSAGIRRMEPAFRSVRFEPHPNYRLRSVKASYHSPSGYYESGWRVEDDGRLTLRVEVPYGCKATLVLPDYKEDFRVEEGKGERDEENCIALESGVFQCSYRTGKNYLHPFSLHSLLTDLMRNEKCAAIVKKELPWLYNSLDGEHQEDLIKTMEEILSWVPREPDEAKDGYSREMKRIDSLLSEVTI